MDNVKNYHINFMKRESITVTSEEGQRIAAAWGEGKLSIFEADAEFYAFHQITSITRDRRVEREVVKKQTYMELSKKKEFLELPPHLQNEEVDKNYRKKFEEMKAKLVIQSMPTPNYQEMLQSRADSGEKRAKNILKN